MDEIIRHIIELYKVDEAEAKKRFENALKEESIQRSIMDAVHFHNTWGTDEEAAALMGK